MLSSRRQSASDAVVGGPRSRLGRCVLLRKLVPTLATAAEGASSPTGTVAAPSMASTLSARWPSGTAAPTAMPAGGGPAAARAEEASAHELPLSVADAATRVAKLDDRQPR